MNPPSSSEYLCFGSNRIGRITPMDNGTFRPGSHLYLMFLLIPNPVLAASSASSVSLTVISSLASKSILLSLP